MRHDSPGRGGFTLVELLIAIAIIGTLLSILVPSLNRARALTRQAICIMHLRGQAQAHALYCSQNHEYKPPLMVRGKHSIRVDYVSPRIKWSNKPVGQGILVAKSYISLEMLYCPSASMRRDRELDQAAWEELPDAGSSYAYFWRHPSCISDPLVPARGATYQEAVDTERTALAMDVNCEAGHSYTGDYEGRDWPSHPVVGKVNVSYASGSARALDAETGRLAYPGGDLEELEWFDKAHRYGKELPEDEPSAGRAFRR